jgi:hypothetical protein
MKIDVRSAVYTAQNYIQSIEDLRLEEVELSDDKQFWFVTLGYNRPVDKSQNLLAELVPSSKFERDYKIFKIDAETGDVKAMKIREI